MASDLRADRVRCGCLADDDMHNPHTADRHTSCHGTPASVLRFIVDAMNGGWLLEEATGWHAKLTRHDGRDQDRITIWWTSRRPTTWLRERITFEERGRGLAGAVEFIKGAS